MRKLKFRSLSGLILFHDIHLSAKSDIPSLTEPFLVCCSRSHLQTFLASKMTSKSVSPNPERITTSFKNVVQLNVGGMQYATTPLTLLREPNSLLAHCIGKHVAETRNSLPRRHGAPIVSESIFENEDGTFFIDRDGILFRYILDYLRYGKLILPENFQEYTRLQEEAKFYQLANLSKLLSKPPITTNSNIHSVKSWPHLRTNSNGILEHAHGGYITVGYRGTFAFGRDGQSDVNFRKLNRILICGKARLCREVFGESLNDSRDPDRGGDERYSSRLYLKHNSLEKCFDQLSDKGYFLISSCGSSAGGSANAVPMPSGGSMSSGDFNLPRTNQMDSEEHKWNHYNEFIFYHDSDDRISE